MCKFKRFGGGPFLSFRGVPEPPSHGPGGISSSSSSSLFQSQRSLKSQLKRKQNMLTIDVARGGGGQGTHPPNRNATNDKNKTKNSCFFRFSFF